MDVTCAVEGCDRPRKTRGWCNTHYERWRRNGDPGSAGDARRRPVTTCSIEGCEKRAKARGLCGTHWSRWRHHGDPTYTERNYGAKRRVRPDGYVDVWLPDHPLAVGGGYVLEHRLVAWNAGLLTEPDSDIHVHHKNEIKHDNGPENLEVMSKGDHHRHHIDEAGYVINQYGIWPVRRNRRTA